MIHAESSQVVVASIGRTPYTVRLAAGGHVLAADEPGDAGGADAGPDPFALLLCSLASCILITMRMYASRKNWPLDGVEARLIPTRKAAQPLEAVHIELTLRGDLSDEQRERLLDIAGRCPVHRTLEPSVRVTRELVTN
jgi:putative redox protein